MGGGNILLGQKITKKRKANNLNSEKEVEFEVQKIHAENRQINHFIAIASGKNITRDRNRT